MSRFLEVPITNDLFFHKRLSNPYNYHKMIWDLWKNGKNKKNTPFLYRCDPNKIIILANDPIENDQVDWLKNCRISTDHNIRYNGSFFYDIIVNPVKRNLRERNHIPLKSDEDIIKWWQRISKNSGFEIDINLIRISCKNNEVSYDAKNNVVTKYKVRIEGLMTVIDPNTFNQQFKIGFGPSKRFGCGLMLIVKKCL
jgi:CRISPR-associated protein Cas6/Cse3/CasE subtype I-E